MQLDLDKFKASPPWKQASFWTALAASVLVMAPVVQQMWDGDRVALAEALLALAGSLPITAWMIAQGYVRGRGVAAAGVAAAAVGPEIARHETIYGPAATNAAAEAELEHDDDDELPDPEGELEPHPALVAYVDAIDEGRDSAEVV